jgi:hypothetical protein
VYQRVRQALRNQSLRDLVGFLGILSIQVRALAPGPRAVWLALVGLALWADAQWFWVTCYWKEDSRAAVAWLGHELPRGATIAVAPSYSITPLAYYSRRAAIELRFLPIPPGVGIPGGTSPDALVLTRLHHVPHWRELKAPVIIARTAFASSLIAGRDRGKRFRRPSISQSWALLSLRCYSREDSKPQVENSDAPGAGRDAHHHLITLHRPPWWWRLQGRRAARHQPGLAETFALASCSNGWNQQSRGFAPPALGAKHCMAYPRDGDNHPLCLSRA